LHGSGVGVSAVASGAVYMVDQLTLLAVDPNTSRQAEQRLRALIELAAALEAPLVTVGGFRGRLSWAGGASARQRLISTLQTAGNIAANVSVRLALEPLNRYETDIIHNTAEGLALLAEIGHPQLGLLLDTFHVNIEESSLTKCFEQANLARKLWHIHLGDNNRLPPGQGHIDFLSIFHTLYQIGYAGYLSAELLPLPDPDMAAEATIRGTRHFLELAKKNGGPECAA